MNGEQRHVSVAVPRPPGERYTYRVPDSLGAAVSRGALVRVPFGGSELIGVVLGETTPLRSGLAAKEVLAVASPSYRVSEELLSLAEWMAAYYLCTLGEAVSAVSFLGMQDIVPSRARGWVRATDWERRADAHAVPRKAREAAERAGAVVVESRAALRKLLGVGPSLFDSLLDAGIFEASDFAPLPRTARPEPPLPLNAAQARALASILPAIEAPRFEASLLFGITGSGKTEVYLQAIARALELGGGAICLVPEIGLTPQTVERFQKRFGEPIGICHSQMSKLEKLDLVRHLEAKRIRIVIGARSALFAPVPDLRLIVVDEEHESSYKQSEAPRYHARDVALVRAQRLRIPVLLGSATPSMESFANARAGRYRMLELKERPAGNRLPEVRIVDLTESVKEVGVAKSGIVSRELREAIDARLAAGEQSLLLLNRRGFSNFLFCSHCKWVARCDEDDAALTVHRRRPRPGAEAEEIVQDLFEPLQAISDGVLRCHFCARQWPVPNICPGCGSPGLMAVGSGTQRLEEDLRGLFPAAKLLRMDADTAGGRRAFLDAWQRMVSGDAQIILGTQMIAKGLHLERVTLVGVLLCDVGLFVPDFRADERTFALLSQVAGRSGRVSPGEVLFQTFMPSHPAIQLAMRHDYETFFELELKRRTVQRFPPMQRLASLTLTDLEESRARQGAETLSGVLRRHVAAGAFPGSGVRGPLPAPIRRLAGRYRYRILVRAERPAELNALLRAAIADRLWKIAGTSRLAVDVDPSDLL